MSTVLRFGRYELHALLGRGGMGEVYRAFDTEQRRSVAVKVLPHTLAGDPMLTERFRREAYAAAKLRGPHVLPVHGSGEIDGRLYIDMRLVDGRDLSTVLAADGPLPPVRAARIVEQVAEALDEAHAARLVHRDVKPSNVMVTDRDFVYLLDFGIAHAIGTTTAGVSLTSTGTTVGTLAYMAPERFVAPDRIDGRVDVYSLACLLFEILTGRRPFTATDLPGLLHAHLNSPVPVVTAFRPDLSAAVDAVLARGMAKDPAHRYPTAGALAADAALALTPAPAQEPPPWPPARTPSAGVRPQSSDRVLAAPRRSAPSMAVGPVAPPPRRRSGRLVGTATAVLVLLGVGALLGTSLTDDTPEAVQPVRTTGTPAATGRPATPGSPAPPAPGRGRPTDAIPAGYAGTWQGRVTQTGRARSEYGVVITMTAGTVRTAVSYPELHCSGVQDLVSAGDSLTLTERITVGTGNCLTSVPITLTLNQDGTQIAYSFSHGGSEGRGVLSRT